MKEPSSVLQQHWLWVPWQPAEAGERRDVDSHWICQILEIKFVGFYCMDFCLEFSDLSKFFFGFYLPKQEEYEAALSLLEKSARLKVSQSQIMYQLDLLPNYPFD